MKPEKNSCRSNVRSLVSGRLLTVLTVVVTMLTALCLSGCATHRKSVTEASIVKASESIRTDSAIHQMTDSTSEVVEVRTEPVKVAMSSVSLTIPTDSLRNLPSGASWNERSGQASVKVSRKAATATEPEYIYVYASCDSLELQCERYERTIRYLHKVYDEHLNEMQGRLSATSHELEEVKEKLPHSIWTELKWYLSGFLSGIIGTIIILIKRKK